MTAAPKRQPLPASGSRVAVIGGANIDLCARQSEAGEAADSLPGTITRAPGGVARNIAENLARLGIRTSLCACVGQDGDGDWLLERTSAAGVDVAHVQRIAGVATPGYVAIHDPRGRLLNAVSDMRAMDRLDYHACESLLAKATALVVDANLGSGLLTRLTSAARVPVFADAVSGAKASRLRDSLANVHTLKANLLEARTLCGLSRASWHDCVDRLLALGVRRTVITLGADGLVYADAEGLVQRGAADAISGTETGAGDAVIAGIVAAWVRDFSVVDQIDYALACGAMVAHAETASNAGLDHERVLHSMSETR